MDNSNPKSLKINSVFGAKLRAAKINGGWQPPQLIFSYVADVKVIDEEPTVFVNDIFIPLQQREDINQVTNSGIGPRLGIPVTFQKADPEKQGAIFKRATVWDDQAKAYTDIPLGAQFTKIVDGHRVEASYSDADRVEVKLNPVFDTVKSNIPCRIGQVRDATADGGWRPSKPWTSMFKRIAEINGVPVECTVVHQTVKLLSTDPILLDRAPRDVEPAAPAAAIGECI